MVVNIPYTLNPNAPSTPQEGSWTPLLIAAEVGHLEVVKVLLGAGASMAATTVGGSLGYVGEVQVVGWGRWGRRTLQHEEAVMSVMSVYVWGGGHVGMGHGARVHVCMCVCVCVCVCVCAQACGHGGMCTCVCAGMRACVVVCVCGHVGGTGTGTRCV